MDRIIVAFASEKSQSQITRLLESGGIYPAGCCFSGAEAIRMVWNLGSAVVVCGFKLRDMTAEELAADLRGIGAVLVIASPAHLDFCTGETLFKLAVPASRADLFASLQLLQDFESRSLQHPGGAAPGGRAPPGPTGQGAADGRPPHDGGGGPPLPAAAQHEHRIETDRDRPVDPGRAPVRSRASTETIRWERFP